MWVEFLTTKDEAFKCFKKVKVLAETKGRCRLRAFRSDRGGEFNSIEFKEYCDENGVKHFTTTPYTPQQNGVVERRNRTVVEMARCLLKSKKVPGEFWGEAVRTAVYLLNRAPTRSLQGRTPYEAWYNKKPKVHHLRTFGCVAHVKKVGPGISKLSDRSTMMVFIGYETGTKGYRFYEPVTKKLHISRDVMFEENRAWKWSEESPVEPAVPAFEVEHFTIAGQVTVTEGSGSDSEDSENPSVPDAASPSSGQWSVGTGSGDTPTQATPPGSPAGQGIEFASPPIGESVNS